MFIQFLSGNGHAFHVLTAGLQFSLALESSVTMDSGTLGHLLRAKPAELHARCTYPELPASVCLCCYQRRMYTVLQACVHRPCCWRRASGDGVVSASQLLSSPFSMQVLSPPRFFFSFSSLAQVLSRSVIKMTRISDMRCSIKILHLPSLLLETY